jgi:hypothetical protein
MHDQFATAVVEHAEQRPFAGLPWRWNAQVRAASRPAWAKYGWVKASDSSPNSKAMSPASTC